MIDFKKRAYETGHQGLELYRTTFKKDLRGVRECLSDVIESALRSARDEGRKEIEKELMCELRDPCGTIWEHAKKQQDDMDKLKADHLKVLEAIKHEATDIEEDLQISILRIGKIVHTELEKLTNTSQ